MAARNPPGESAPVTPWSLLRDAGEAWIDDRCASLGASLAYYTLFSLAPLLLIVVSIAGLFFGAEAARGEVQDQLQGLLGPSGASAVQDLLASANWPAGSLLATVGGVVLMLIGATTVFAELQGTLDHIWGTPASRSPGWWALLRARLLSFGLVLGVGFLLIVSLLVSAAMSAVQKLWSPWLGGWSALVDGIGALFGFALMTVLFAMIYKWMPRTRIAWRDVWLGAVTTSALFLVGRQLIGLYIGHGAVTSGFAAAGSLVAVLVWVYYSAQIFLFGAELTWIFAHRLGSRRGVTAMQQADAATEPSGSRPTTARPAGRW